MIPLIIKLAADEAVQNIKEVAKRQVEAEKLIPTYREMRQARIHPDMDESERMAYRANKVQNGYIAGTVGGGVIGGIAGTALGTLLKKTRFGKSMPGTTYALQKYVLPATIGYSGYRFGAIEGRKAGERIARRKLNESGNTIPYINPISLTDRGASDPIFMGTMMGAKTLQAAVSDKGREKVEHGIMGTKPGTRLSNLFKGDANTIANMLKRIRR